MPANPSGSKPNVPEGNQRKKPPLTEHMITQSLGSNATDPARREELYVHLNALQNEIYRKGMSQTNADMEKTDESGQSKTSATGIASYMSFGLATPEHSQRVKTRQGVRNIMVTQSKSKVDAAKIYAKQQAKRTLDLNMQREIHAFLQKKRDDTKAQEGRLTTEQQRANALGMKDIRLDRTANAAAAAAAAAADAHSGGKKKIKRPKTNKKASANKNKPRTNKKGKYRRKSKTHKKRNYRRKSRRH